MGKATRRRGAAFLLTAVLLSCALALAGCAGGAGGDKAGASGEGTLRVGVRSDVVGFGYLNENTGKYYGLEIDIAEELARRDLGCLDSEPADYTELNARMDEYMDEFEKSGVENLVIEA